MSTGRLSKQQQVGILYHNGVCEAGDSERQRARISWRVIFNDVGERHSEFLEVVGFHHSTYMKMIIIYQRQTEIFHACVYAVCTMHCTQIQTTNLRIGVMTLFWNSHLRVNMCYGVTREHFSAGTVYVHFQIQSTGVSDWVTTLKSLDINAQFAHCSMLMLPTTKEVPVHILYENNILIAILTIMVLWINQMALNQTISVILIFCSILEQRLWCGFNRLLYHSHLTE